MPKIKTNKLARKKFRVTKKGRVKRSQAFMSHNTAMKSPRRARRLRVLAPVSEADQKVVKGLLPNG